MCKSDCIALNIACLGKSCSLDFQYCYKHNDNIIDNTSCPYAGDFRCVINGGCIREYDVCDVIEDCLDGSDEGLNCKYD